ncbi:hypothetical protein AQUCO_03400092v1 [Aquilegia coerulea]|uniref:Uncharacterized protein n=1 Tax=Aquilegia coerulea TaxID=218851 RepID=A0A2G5CXG6_AQUCA|nr:hypothetical protein AQUCO_03400092v1 [Aquilegia coerulea]
MLGMLDDRNYLYQATNNIRSAKNQDGHMGDHLAVYKPQEKSSSILELSGAPTNFHTTGKKLMGRKQIH